MVNVTGVLIHTDVGVLNDAVIDEVDNEQLEAFKGIINGLEQVPPAVVFLVITALPPSISLVFKLRLVCPFPILKCIKSTLLITCPN